MAVCCPHRPSSAGHRANPAAPTAKPAWQSQSSAGKASNARLNCRLRVSCHCRRFHHQTKRWRQWLPMHESGLRHPQWYHWIKRHPRSPHQKRWEHRCRCRAAMTWRRPFISGLDEMRAIPKALWPQVRKNLTRHDPRAGKNHRRCRPCCQDFRCSRSCRRQQYRWARRRCFSHIHCLRRTGASPRVVLSLRRRMSNRQGRSAGR